MKAISRALDRCILKLNNITHTRAVILSYCHTLMSDPSTCLLEIPTWVEGINKFTSNASSFVQKILINILTAWQFYHLVYTKQAIAYSRRD